MWLLGVPWDQAQAAGGLMGTKAILNEYVAYLELAALPDGTFDPRAKLIVTYAMCGFANLASVGLLVSTIGTLAPVAPGGSCRTGHEKLARRQFRHRDDRGDDRPRHIGLRG